MGLISCLLALMQDIKVTFLHEIYVVGISADELLNFHAVDQRNFPLLHLATHEIDFGSKVFRFLLGHRSGYGSNASIELVGFLVRGKNGINFWFGHETEHLVQVQTMHDHIAQLVHRAHKQNS